MNALHWLVLVSLFTALLWIPYILNRFLKIGIAGTLKNPGPDDEARHSAWAQRATKAHKNSVENLIVFASLVLVAAALGIADHPWVIGAAQLFFVSRVFYVLVFTLGIPVLRTLSFLAGFAAQVIVGLSALALGGAL